MIAQSRFFSLTKKVFSLTLLSWMLLLTASCRPAPLAVPTPIVTTAPTVELTSPPSPTTKAAVATPLPSTLAPTTVTASTTAPAPTESFGDSATSNDVPPCFATYNQPIGYLPDGNRIAIRGDNGVQIFNLQTMKEESFIQTPENSIVTALALSPNGKIIAWALQDNTIQLVQVSDKKLLHTLSGHTDWIGKLRFSPSGDRLYSASHDTWVRVWDLNGNQLGSFQVIGAGGWPDQVLGIGISPDGKTVSTIPFDGPVDLWDAENFQLIKALGGSAGFDTSDIVFSPDGQFIAADTATGLFLWKTLDGTQLLGGNPGINSMAVAFSPDGKYLAYSDIGENSEIVLSSPDGSEQIRTLEGQLSPIGDLIFSPDGSTLLSSDWVEIRVWRVEDGKLMAVGKSACP